MCTAIAGSKSFLEQGIELAYLPVVLENEKILPRCCPPDLSHILALDYTLQQRLLITFIAIVSFSGKENPGFGGIC